MGFAHLQSFSKQNFEIHIVEKNKTKKIKFLKKKNFLIKNLHFFHKIPKNNKYLLAISATQSRERYQLIKKLLISNKTKYLLLEKFCFLNLKDFRKFEEKFSHKTKVFVNSWAYIIAKKTKLKSKLDNFTLECKVPEGSLLSNITHMLHIFSYLNKKQSIKKICNSKYSITKSLKRKGYDELIGEIKLKDTGHNILRIKTKKKMLDFMNISILQKKPKINYQILFKNNFMVYFIKNKKIINKFKFPLSSKTSLVFLSHCLKKKFNYMPSFKIDYSLSRPLLEKYDIRIP